MFCFSEEKSVPLNNSVHVYIQTTKILCKYQVKCMKWSGFSFNVVKQQEEEENEISTSPGVSEFVSDAFDSCNIDHEDLRKEMEQLVLDKKEDAATPEGQFQNYQIISRVTNNQQELQSSIG